MYDRKALAGRMARARPGAGLDERGKTLSYERIGKLLEARIGGPTAYSASTVQRYFDGDVKRIGVEVLLAYARITGVPPGWLAFGDESENGKVPPPLSERALPIGRRGSTSRAAKRGKAG